MVLDTLAPWLLMWLLAGIVFLGCKGLTWWAAPARGSVITWLAWPGLDAAAFFATADNVARPRRREWLFAGAKALLGAALFWGGGRLAGEHYLLRGWLGMIGVVFLLHFGLFHLLSCLWRTLGRNARPIMDHPWAATSVSDFWGRRWNRAFRDVTHRFLFRPMVRSLGPKLALVVSFVLSGLIHEAVITLPAQGGYGGPTLYFCLQAVGLGVERSSFGVRLGLGRGWRGWLFAAAVVLGPAGCLFPPSFVRAIVLPMMDACGAA